MTAELLGANYATTTVGSGGYSSGASHLNVVSSSTGTGLAPFPSAGNFRVSIFNQSTGAPEVILLVTAINSGTQFATTAEVDGNASAGDIVICTLTSGGVGALLAQLNQQGTFASLPSTVPFAGCRYKQTDGPYEWISNGSVWVPYWNGYQVTTPPTSGWTSEGIASQSGCQAGAVHYTNGFGHLVGNNYGAESFGSQYMTAPSTPYGIIARMVMDTSGIIGQATYFSDNGFEGPSTQTGNGIGFRDSAGKYLVMGFIPLTGPNCYFNISFFNSDESINENVASISNLATVSIAAAQKDWAYKIHNDGTNLTFSMSIDGGQTFLVVWTETITTNLSDAQSVCWGAHKYNGSAAICLYDWTQTS